jgi:photosystem II stability/assembly factor-like uncharacterized protein
MDELYFLATDRGILTARREGSDWTEVSRSLVEHDVTAVTTHGSQLLVGTRRGILLSDDLGTTWRHVYQGLDIEHVRWLTYHPQFPSFAYVGTEPAAVFISRDGAQSWEQCPEVARLRDENEWYLPYSPEAGCVRGFAFLGERGYAAVEQGGLLRSDDRGETWRMAEGSTGDPRAHIPEAFIHPDVHSVVVHPSSPDLVYAPTGGGLYRSQDGGKSWAHLYDCYCRAMWADPDDADHLIFGPADSVDREGRIEESVDGGRTWRPASAGLDAPWPEHMVERFVQAGDRLLAVLSNGHLLATSLEFISWRRVLPEVEGINATTFVR